MVRNRWHSRYPEISMVRCAYLFILIGCTLVNIPAIMNSFLSVCRKEDNFMELQLVREQFQSDMIGKDNFNSVEIRKV